MKSLPLAFALVAIALPAAASSYRLGAVEVVDPWSRPAAAGMNGVGYMAIKNNGKTPIVLTGASTPLAAKISLHQTSMAGGVMRMAPVSGGLTVPPGGTVTLAPAGYHMMLEGLTKPLALGQRAPVTLTFADGKKMQIDLSVQTSAGAAPARPATGAMGSMPGMNH
jgi:copper(I)-binding protein